MSRYPVTQTRKLLSAYGGVGSILETINGAIIVKPFNEWRYFVEIQNDRIEEPPEIEDPRLWRRLRFNFRRLERFLALPINTSSLQNPSVPDDRRRIANGKYFPEWMYCSRCKRFKPVSEWWQEWRDETGQRAEDTFFPPKCAHCYKNKPRRWIKLEQVRFIMTAPNGEIADIPWKLWTRVSKRQGGEATSEASGVFLPDDGNPCCDRQDLRYLKSTTFSDLTGVRIKCENPQCPTNRREVNLTGLFSLRVFAREITNRQGLRVQINFKPVIRSSNSVYYPLISRSLFLPHGSLISKEVKRHILKYYGEGKTAKEIAAFHNLSLRDVQQVIAPPETENYVEEEEYRRREFRFFSEREHFAGEHLSFERIPIANMQPFGVQQIVKVRRLKMTSVQTGYTRQEPLDSDIFAELGEDFIEINEKHIKVHPTSTYGLSAQFLPAVESFGEGIFLSFDPQRLNDWFDQYFEVNENFTRRLQNLQQNAQRSNFNRFGFLVQVDNPRHLAKLLVLHTISHLLVKELEFSVGYPATSLRERLYLDNDQMVGVLMYTIAGAEGSYGGLISQSDENRFVHLLQSALIRAADCASDPVCFETQEGQGVGGLNMAACYSCSLVPEPSCEIFNCWLDRAMLIDRDYGYFKFQESL